MNNNLKSAEHKYVFVPVSVDDRLPPYPQIVIVLIDGRLQMQAQIRPSVNGHQWWTLGDSRIEENKKCVTHWLKPVLVSEYKTQYLNQQLPVDDKSENDDCFVFSGKLKNIKQTIWQFCYRDNNGLNQHSGVYFKEEEAIKGMKDFLSLNNVK